MTNKYKKTYILSHQEGAAPRAKKSLGQNFLHDSNIARKIVNTLSVDSEDWVLEIGPGPGALSGFLQEKAPARLLLVEKDPHWARARLREGRLRAFAAQGAPLAAFDVLLADAMTMPWERFTRPWKFIGNLPYNVASPLMWDIFSRAGGLVRAVFMIQKEVGQRITARPGESAYGALSVWVQSHVRAKLEFIVPPQVFRPQPKVDSAVLSFEPLCGTGDAGAAFGPAALARTLRICFQMRRKQLGSIMRENAFSVALLEELGFDPRIRPENLAPADFHRLSQALFGKD